MQLTCHTTSGPLPGFGHRTSLGRLQVKILGGPSQLVTPIYKPFRPFNDLEWEQPQLGDLLPIVANHLLSGVVLQVQDACQVSCCMAEL